MVIPNDSGHPWRLNKFVEYQHEVPSIHYRIVREYIIEHDLSEDDAVMLAWYLSVTYNEVTAILLFNMFSWRTVTKAQIRNLWATTKSLLDFGSARKYAKNMDWFVPLMDAFMTKIKRHPSAWIHQFDTGTSIDNYLALNKELHAIPFVGRFAADIFLETIASLNARFSWSFNEPTDLDWRNCSNLTSGVYNIFYRDDAADRFDDTHKILITEGGTAYLEDRLVAIQQAIIKTYPNQDAKISMFIGKICSFRNLFKNSRYGGFHHDRQLGVIREYERVLPQYKNVWENIYGLRYKMFDIRFLGEYADWTGIRKERKKLWTTQGKTGVELNVDEVFEGALSQMPQTTSVIPVINLRGANGSGKTWIVKKWMQEKHATPQPQRNNLLGGSTLANRPEYYLLDDGGIVIGPYTTDCGGCDSIKSTEEVRQAILAAIQRKPSYVLFEGVIISTVFQSWLEFSRQIGGMIWVYLDTPLEVCLQRVNHRNHGKQIKRELVEDKVRRIATTRNKAEQAREQVVLLHWTTAFEEFQKFLKSALRH